MTRATPTILGSGICALHWLRPRHRADTNRDSSAARHHHGARSHRTGAEAGGSRPRAKPAPAHAVAGGRPQRESSGDTASVPQREAQDSRAARPRDLRRGQGRRPRRGRRKDDRQAASRHDAAARAPRVLTPPATRRSITAIEIDHRLRGRGAPESRPPHVPATQSRRVQSRACTSCSRWMSTPASGCRSIR